MIGKAMENYTENDPEKIGKILVNLQIGYGTAQKNLRGNLLELLRVGIDAPFITPLLSLRYILAALVVVISFVFGFLFFGRVARTGVEAMGRNPLAIRSIAVGVVVNFLLTLSIMLIGLAVAYLILTV